MKSGNIGQPDFITQGFAIPSLIPDKVKITAKKATGQRSSSVAILHSSDQSVGDDSTFSSSDTFICYCGSQTS